MTRHRTGREDAACRDASRIPILSGKAGAAVSTAWVHEESLVASVPDWNAPSVALPPRPYIQTLSEQLNARPAEIKRLLRGELEATRTRKPSDEMLAAGLPL